MSDELSDRLAAAVDGAAAPVTADEATLRGKRYARRRVAVTAGVAVVAVLVAGVAVAAAATRRSSGPKVFVGDTTTSTTAKSAPLSAHIELPATMITAGSSATGHLVIENNTGAAVHLAAEPGCLPNWKIVLRNREIPQQAAFPLSCESHLERIAPGKTTLPFTLVTTYQSCSGAGGSLGPVVPRCLAGSHGVSGGAPPLPAGLYQATFFSQMPNFPAVPPVPVLIVSSAPPTTAGPSDALSQYLDRHTDVVVHTAPVSYGSSEIALVGTETDAQHRNLVVLSLAGSAASPLTTLTLPSPDYDFARSLPIQVGDVTGDGLPDFLVRFDAAGNQPGVVVSADGGTWRLVPQSADLADVYIGRDPAITNGRLQTTRNDCIPTCAQGHNTTVTWRYDKQSRRLVPQ